MIYSKTILIFLTIIPITLYASENTVFISKNVDKIRQRFQLQINQPSSTLLQTKTPIFKEIRQFLKTKDSKSIDILKKELATKLERSKKSIIRYIGGDWSTFNKLRFLNEVSFNQIKSAGVIRMG